MNGLFGQMRMQRQREYFTRRPLRYRQHLCGLKRRLAMQRHRIVNSRRDARCGETPEQSVTFPRAHDVKMKGMPAVRPHDRQAQPRAAPEP